MDNPVHEQYGGRVRARVCGICIMGDRLVMVRHRFLGDGGFWAPPGGGIEFGEDARASLAREFLEETGLTVDVGPYLFTCELVQPPLHAVELFFHVIHKGGEISVGADPESGDRQIIENVVLMSSKEVRELPPGQVHGILTRYPDIRQITSLRGYFKL